MQQQTLKSNFSLSGKGLHTGLTHTVTFLPAPENHGYRIQRTDLAGMPVIEAIADNVAATDRCTAIQKDGVQVHTIEHALAALYASGIDNCLMQVDGPEFPILDGSAKCYVDEIKRVGIVAQQEERICYELKSKVEVKDEHGSSSLTILPDDHFSIDTLIGYDSPILSNSYSSLNELHQFAEEIAASRTFVFVRDIEPLLEHGLIKGGDLDNAIVIYDQFMSQDELNHLADLMNVAHPDAAVLGYLNHRPLTWTNECARHKLLDVMGDLALTGKYFKGHVIATHPGHAINAKAALKLRHTLAVAASDTKISPQAYVHPEAQLGLGVEIGAFAYIDRNVVIGEDTVIMPGAKVLSGARIGKRNTIFPGAVISGIPQDMKFKGEDTLAIIGDDNTIRENVTVNRGTAAKGQTIIGHHNLIMEGAHVAHDSTVGNYCIIGNSTKLAGEMIMDDYSNLSANVLIHQFCRVGGYGIIQGGSRLPKDVPPYIVAAREPTCYCGINLIGLRRHGFSNETIEQIHKAYRLIYESNLSVTNALSRIEAELEQTPEIRYIVDFIRSSKRGIISSIQSRE